eukprot:5231461-Alexandrium_andersonii.AAC.1
MPDAAGHGSIVLAWAFPKLWVDGLSTASRADAESDNEAGQRARRRRFSGGPRGGAEHLPREDL